MPGYWISFLKDEAIDVCLQGIVELIMMIVQMLTKQQNADYQYVKITQDTIRREIEGLIPKWRVILH